MSTKLFIGLGAAAMAFACVWITDAEAAGKEWKFEVTNRSNNAIVEFRTQEDGEWSENWISARIEPGDTNELDFESDEGDCEVRTQIRFTNGLFFDADVDYCKADKIDIFDDTMVWKK